MGWRYHKSVMFGKGVRVNFGKKHGSISFGSRMFHTNISSHGIHDTFSIPGTGISYTSSNSKRRRKNQHGFASIIITILILGIIFSAIAPYLLVIVGIFLIGAIIYFLVHHIKSTELSGNITNNNSQISDIARLNMEQEIKDNLRISNDCAKLINTSSNLEVVISRFDLLLSSLEKLKKYDDQVVFNGSKTPSQKINELNHMRTQIINQAIKRSFIKESKYLAELKTEKGRSASRAKYINELKRFSTKLEPDNLKYIEELILNL